MCDHYLCGIRFGEMVTVVESVAVLIIVGVIVLLRERQDKEIATATGHFLMESFTRTGTTTVAFFHCRGIQPWSPSSITVYHRTCDPKGTEILLLGPCCHVSPPPDTFLQTSPMMPQLWEGGCLTEFPTICSRRGYHSFLFNGRCRCQIITSIQIRGPIQAAERWPIYL